MFEVVNVAGYEALKKAVAEKTLRTIILFTGGIDPSTGKSWCPDCVAADPHIEKCVEEIKNSEFAKQNETRFIVCNVGDRPYWKDRSNPFRTDEAFKVNCVPTLLDCSVKGKRLTEGQLTNDMLIKDFFTEDF